MNTIHGIFKIRKELGKKVLQNEPMREHTTLGLGGPARLLSVVMKEEELEKFIQLSLKFGVPFLVIGDGSDLLVSDDGFDGFVIVNKVEGIKLIKDKVVVKAGTNLQKFINFCIDKGFSGMEKMSGIPGTVGGAVYGDAGAYGQTASDYLISVKSFDGKRVRLFTKKQCKFRYRESIFKKNREAIFEAEFKFEKGVPEFLKKVSLDTITLRNQKYHTGIKCPGSFFKNIIVDKLNLDILSKIPRDKIVFGKIPAGYLMEAVGAKGQQRGSIKIADDHGNLIINLGNGTAKDFMDLAFEFAKKVEKKFGIKLEPEVQLIGFKEHGS